MRRRKDPFFGKKINLGGGRFLDPVTGRVYVDSRDMDGFLDAAMADWQDRPSAADHSSINTEMPPPDVQRLATEAEQQERQRIVQQARGEHRDNVNGRLKTLRGKKAWRDGQGMTLDDEDAAELLALETLIDPKRRRAAMGRKRAKHFAWLDE